MKTRMIFAGAAVLFALAGCSKNEENPDSGNAAQLEQYSMNQTWVNYATATASELLDDCIALWASWAGPSAVGSEDMARIADRNIFSQASVGANGYGALMKSPNGTSLVSEVEVIRMILTDGFANIANEVGAAKIGDPNALAKAGRTSEAVLQVESWYSWNSIKDYSDNIVSIMNGYMGRYQQDGVSEAPNVNSISNYLAAKGGASATLDADVNAAITLAYNKIKGMQHPFRSNLTGTKVDEAIAACAALTELIEGRLMAAFQNAGGDDFSAILAQYVDNVVIPTYFNMKEAAWELYNAMAVLQADIADQSKIDAACTAWKAVRIPWEQSEAVLFGPAGEENGLGLDPSLDSWPLDQEEIATMLINHPDYTVDQFIRSIGSESVRGFHTIELLLFKNGQNRTVRQ